MDKDAYTEQMERDLQELAERLNGRVFPSPSTLDASLKQDEAMRQVEELKTRVAEALADVRALRASTDPSWEQARQDLDRRWQELSGQKK
ncbi:MAG TPA: hypothetical protein VF586_06620 [Pyrinomonadaceae bacterium]|jgi:hypothetical protein